MANKTYYHSKLVQEGPIDVTITCDGPLKSKYANQPDYISFKMDGVEHYLPIENESCGEALSGLKGQDVTIEGFGSRDDATVTVTGGQQTQHRPAARQQPASRPAGGSSGRQTQQAAAPRQSAEEKAAAEDKAFKRMKAYGARVGVAMRASFRFARSIAKDELPGATSEDIRAIAAMHFIETKSMTDLACLPVVMPADPAPGTAAQAPAPARRPTPPPEPEPEPEPAPEAEEEVDDIPF